MTSDLPLPQLHEWCHWLCLERVGTTVLSVQDWKEGLAQRIAALDPGTIDAPYAVDNDVSDSKSIDAPYGRGLTALGLLASSRPPLPPIEDAVILIIHGVEKLLAAGANPLIGSTPAILQGMIVSESLAVNKMLAALVAAQKEGQPYRGASGGNLLHAMANGHLRMLAHLARDNFKSLPLDGIWDVVADWRDEVDAQGKTPIDLAWEQYPTSNQHSIQTEAEAAAIWSLLLPGIRPKSLWQPPLLDMQCADGQLLYQRVLSKVDQGMPVPEHAEVLVEHLRAMALGDRLDKDTPFPSGATPLRPRRI